LVESKHSKHSSGEDALKQKRVELAQRRQDVDSALCSARTTRDVQAAADAFYELEVVTREYHSLVEEQVQKLRQVLGKNFLGAEEWKIGLGVDVGSTPVIPEALSEELLRSPCPLHPGKAIHETHALVLIPKELSGQPNSLVNLRRVSADAGHNLVETFTAEATGELWVYEAPRASTWILIPRSDPVPGLVPEERCFRGKIFEQQRAVYETHYALTYRPACVAEVITAALLCDVVHNDRDWLGPRIRFLCAGGPIEEDPLCVGRWGYHGKAVFASSGTLPPSDFGIALVRKL
jgi:hypothetical protein